MDAFSAQIIKFVREMPAEALLELVKQKLGAGGAPQPRPVPAPHQEVRKAPTAAPPVPAQRVAAASGHPAKKKSVAKAKPVTASARPANAPPQVVVSAERQGVLEHVERVVKAGHGVSASDVAKAANLPQPRAAAALKELKLAKRIFQGGDRRFARYAADAKTAEQASVLARKSAKGSS